MYSVMIAEDELLVRLGIASSVQWEQNDMRIVAETSDGQSAWEAFLKFHPDIILLDIRMPKIDGIELLRRIRETDEDCAVILITNVENEDMLCQAKKQGVSDVLLKASMKQQDIMKAAVTACNELSKKQRRGNAQEEAVGNDWKRIIFSNIEDSRNSTELFVPMGFIVMRVRPSETLSARLEKSLLGLFSHRIQTVSSGTVVSNDNVFVYLFNSVWDKEVVKKVLSDLNWYANDNFGENYLFVVSKECSPHNNIRYQAQQAMCLLHTPELFNDGILLLNEYGYPYIGRLEHIKSLLLGMKPVFVDTSDISDCLKDMEHISVHIAEGWSSCKSFAKKSIMHLTGRNEEIDGFNDYLSSLEVAEKQFEKERMRDIPKQIIEAINYMKAHLSEKLSSQEIAKFVGYHPAYFSNLFKQTTGVGYSDFLNDLRIEYAKELMSNTQDGLSEIAEKCGFQDLSYFSIKFKKAEGVTPSQWRNAR